MRTVSAVVAHYPRERRPNLPVLVEALRSGTRVPDEIVVWNNDGEPLRPIPGATVIESPRNVGSKARFLAALTARSDYVLFQDNDVALLPDALELLVGYAERLPHAVLTLSGRVLIRGQGYRSSTLARCPAQLTRVDVSLGQVELVERAALPRLLAHFPFEAATRMDDLYFSAACRDARWDILSVPRAGFRDLDMHGVGACKEPDHYLERDMLCRALFPAEGAEGGSRAELGRA